jgi:hypothetical protein
LGSLSAVRQVRRRWFGSTKSTLPVVESLKGAAQKNNRQGYGSSERSTVTAFVVVESTLVVVESLRVQYNVIVVESLVQQQKNCQGYGSSERSTASSTLPVVKSLIKQYGPSSFGSSERSTAASMLKFARTTGLAVQSAVRQRRRRSSR